MINMLSLPNPYWLLSKLAVNIKQRVIREKNVT